jgi:hypothetical protein
MREWMSQEMPVEIPSKDVLLADLTCLGYKRRSNGQLLLESKDDLKSRGVKSPDAADALALTFFVGNYLQNSVFQPNYLPQESAGMFI